MTVTNCQKKDQSGSGDIPNQSSQSHTAVIQGEKEELGPVVGNSVVKIRYFYSETHRCGSCMKIEAYTKQAVNESFANELKSGKMEFSLVDMDKAVNKPAMKKYKLFTKSVIVSEYSGDEEVRWQNLDKVWKLLGNEEKFKGYISKEIKSYL
jgi:hypothetical protein